MFVLFQNLHILLYDRQFFSGDPPPEWRYQKRPWFGGWFGTDDGVRSTTVGRDVLGRMAEAVSGVWRMREFRRYVADTAGRRLVQLWMDIERFHRVDAGDERSRWLLYREIQITFYEFHHDAPAPAAAAAAAARSPRADQHDANCVLVGTCTSPGYSAPTRPSIFSGTANEYLPLSMNSTKETCSIIFQQCVTM